MKVTLVPNWQLTSEHAASSWGQPVLVNRTTREAYGPCDMVKCYSSWDWMTAADAVRCMAKMRKQSARGLGAIKAFLGTMPPA